MVEAVAQDGLLAYTLPEQTREKLWQIERLTNIFCTAMKNKWTLVYADMMAGPGLCIDEFTREERRGSALIAAARPEFSRLFINDANERATDDLRARLRSEPEGRVLIRTDDCNAVVDEARDFLFPVQSRRQTLGLAVIDPSAYQMRFESIARLSSGVKLDLMIILMTSYMRRFLTMPSFSEPICCILGDDQVRSLIQRRRSGERLTYDDFLDCFQRQLEGIGYSHTHHTSAMNSVESVVYHVVYASRNPLGREFYAKASSRRSDGQIVMPLFT